MKKILTIFCFFLTISTNGQIASEKSWPISVQKEIEFLKTQNVDTILLSYAYLGPWVDIADSCKYLDDIWIIYHQNNYFAKSLSCLCFIKTISIPISSNPIRFFVRHINDFKTQETYFKTHTQLPPFQTDVSSDHLIFMTNNNKIAIEISDYQKVDSIWSKYPWIKPTIEAIELTKTTIHSHQLQIK